MQTQVPPKDKAFTRLKSLVGFDCVVHLRSSPETIITGILDSFDIQMVPSIIVIDCGKEQGRRIINFQDVSVIREIIN